MCILYKALKTNILYIVRIHLNNQMYIKKLNYFYDINHKSNEDKLNVFLFKWYRSFPCWCLSCFAISI